MKASFILLIAIYLLCNATRFYYEILKKNGKIDIESKLFFAFIFSIMCLMWISWFSACPQDIWHLGLPTVIKWAGLGVFILGALLAFGALFQLRGVENINHLVTNGLFARFRHPMYTGFILWIIGWAIYHDAIISSIAGIPGIANILYWRYLEDRDLEKKYGLIYANYRSQTWF